RPVLLRSFPVRDGQGAAELHPHATGRQMNDFLSMMALEAVATEAGELFHLRERDNALEFEPTRCLLGFSVHRGTSAEQRAIALVHAEDGTKMRGAHSASSAMRIMRMLRMGNYLLRPRARRTVSQDGAAIPRFLLSLAK